MQAKLEGLGVRLLGLFVPKVDASAVCRSHSYCTQCGCGCYACCSGAPGECQLIICDC
ncbi:hypothetical protein [Plantactinospora sonchi]|uniref:Bacteriocin n=1 Tax=Plantactinospora sonchi TaxID=1544735 RepID=A0ABU7RXU4_9ACTN